MRCVMSMRSIGDLQVSAIGMGAMTLTQTLKHEPRDARPVLEAAVDSGITLFDTADSYGPTGDMGVNESALIEGLRAIPGALERVVVATKGGHTRGPNATWWIDGSPDYLARAARASCQRLGLEALPLYHHHRPDPRVPYADSMIALKQLVDDGVVMRVGVSNVTLELLDIAREVLGTALVSVQNELSPSRLDDLQIVQRCEAWDIAFLAWGPLGGMRAAKSQSMGIVAIAEIASAHGVSPQQVALAWLLSISPVVIPIPGASRPESIRDSARAVALHLSETELRALDTALIPEEVRSACV